MKMGTKNKPGKFDCYDKAEPDEPVFVLLGRDPHASALVEMWANVRQELGEDPEKVAEARHCSDEMARWAREKGKSPLPRDLERGPRAPHGPRRIQEDKDG